MTIPDTMRLPSAERHDPSHRFDYKGQHRYIITLPTYHAKTLFTDHDRVFAVLARLREEAAAHKFDVYAYCALPDRLLLIIRGREETSDMKEFLSAFRGTTNAIVLQQIQHPVWSKKYIERVLRKGEESRDIAKQMFLAPVRERLVAVATEYPFFGSFVVPVEKILLPPAPRRPIADGKRSGGTRKPFPAGKKPWGNKRPDRRPHRPGRPR